MSSPIREQNRKIEANLQEQGRQAKREGDTRARIYQEQAEEQREIDEYSMMVGRIMELKQKLQRNEKLLEWKFKMEVEIEELEEQVRKMEDVDALRARWRAAHCKAKAPATNPAEPSSKTPRVDLQAPASNPAEPSSTATMARPEAPAPNPDEPSSTATMARPKAPAPNPDEPSSTATMARPKAPALNPDEPSSTATMANPAAPATRPEGPRPSQRQVGAGRDPFIDQDRMRRRPLPMAKWPKTKPEAGKRPQKRQRRC
jgi:hypothetical protein